MRQQKQLKQLSNLDKYPVFTHDDYIWTEEEYVWMNDDYVWTDEECVWTDDDFYLKESDFYPPPDDRVWKSNIEDIEGGDNFADFCAEFFKMLDEEEYWDN